MSTYSKTHGSASIWDAALYPSAGSRDHGFTHPFAQHPNYVTILEMAQQPGSGTVALVQRKAKKRNSVSKNARTTQLIDPPRRKYACYPHQLSHGLVQGGEFGFQNESSCPRAHKYGHDQPESPRGRCNRAASDFEKSYRGKQEVDYKPYCDHEDHPRGKSSRFSKALDPYPDRKRC